MIKCKIRTGAEVEYISISGHANFAEYGSDIVCSAVSMLAYAIANQLHELKQENVVAIKKNEFIFEHNANDNQVNLLLTTLANGLRMVENEYGEYINIKEV